MYNIRKIFLSVFFLCTLALFTKFIMSNNNQAIISQEYDIALESNLELQLLTNKDEAIRRVIKQGNLNNFNRLLKYLKSLELFIGKLDRKQVSYMLKLIDERRKKLANKTGYSALEQEKINTSLSVLCGSTLFMGLSGYIGLKLASKLSKDSKIADALFLHLSPLLPIYVISTFIFLIKLYGELTQSTLKSKISNAIRIKSKLSELAKDFEQNKVVNQI